MKTLLTGILLFTTTTFAGYQFDGVVKLNAAATYTFVASDENAEKICLDAVQSTFQSYDKEPFTMKGANGLSSLTASTSSNIENTLLISEIQVGRVHFGAIPSGKVIPATIQARDGRETGFVLVNLKCK